MNRLQQASIAIMRIAPLFPAAAGLITGIVLDESLPLPFFIYALLFVLGGVPAISAALRATVGPFFIFVAAAGIGGGRFDAIVDHDETLAYQPWEALQDVVPLRLRVGKDEPRAAQDAVLQSD